MPDAEPPATEDSEPPFQPGERVRVLVGPFADFPGVVRAMDTDLQRLNVGVVIFRRETPVVLDFTQATKLDPNAE
jgi:transcription termination/antitermination protein NusG